jgi:hypothetical protein
MDCRLNPAAANLTNGSRMRPLLALLVIVPLLGGCFERGQTVAVDTPQPPPPDDDAVCRANNTQPGSPAYIVCRKERDAARAKSEARADRAQRNLGEYMLNNPVRPYTGDSR